VGGGGFGYSTLIEPRRVEINHLRLAVKGLPRAFDGLTIAHLTDLHRSRFVSADYLNHCVALANATHPDLILFTGDYLTHGTSGQDSGRVYGNRDVAPSMVTDCARCMARARGKHGVFAALGNH